MQGKTVTFVLICCDLNSVKNVSDLDLWIKCQLPTSLILKSYCANTEALMLPVLFWYI